MPLIKSGAQAILDAINTSASIGLTIEDVQFSLPTVIDNPPDNRNTQVKLQMTQVAPALGAVLVKYHRLDFSEIFTDNTGANPMVIPIAKWYNTSLDCLSAIRQYLGIDITADDLVSAEIDLNDRTVLIKANPNSLGWTGQVVAQLIDGDSIIGGVFDQLKLTGLFAYPYFNTNLGQAGIYSYRFDFTDYGAQLKTLTSDTINLVNIAAMLKAVTKQDWTVARNPSDYNLKDSEFLYNGLNNNPLYPGNTNYTRVLILNLAFYSLKLGGYLYIHYNA